MTRGLPSRSPEGKTTMKRNAPRNPVVKPKPEPKPRVSWRFTDWAAI